MLAISTLVALADELRVGALAQPPYCADTSRPVTEVLGEATQNGFDLLPVKRGSEPITRVVGRSALAGLADWRQLDEIAEPLTADLLVSADAPALSVLDRLDPHSVLFTLGASGVEGVITIYDVNEPSAHLLAFGLILVCEEALAEWLRQQLGSDVDAALATIRRLKVDGSGFRRWQKLRKADQHGDLASALTLHEKIEVADKLGAAKLATHFGFEADGLIPRLKRVCELRNAIGHINEARLEDPSWVRAGMLEARDLARRLAT